MSNSLSHSNIPLQSGLQAYCLRSAKKLHPIEGVRHSYLLVLCTACFPGSLYKNRHFLACVVILLYAICHIVAVSSFKENIFILQ